MDDGIPAIGVTFRRLAKFNIVGLAGIVVQTVVLAVLIRAAKMNYLIATAIAVEAAILHNFFWHHRWTWGDRNHRNFSLLYLVARLLRFNLTTGLVSILGNLVFTGIFVGIAGLSPVPANLIAIAMCSIINFLVNDRFVFE